MTEVRKPLVDIFDEEPETIIDTFEWRKDAACIGHNTNDWFPERGRYDTKVAEFCNKCLVREECLDYALVNSIKFGIWGGLSERQRRKIRSQRLKDKKEQAA